jgi:hypothetical protein
VGCRRIRRWPKHWARSSPIAHSTAPKERVLTGPVAHADFRKQLIELGNIAFNP